MIINDVFKMADCYFEVSNGIKPLPITALSILFFYHFDELFVNAPKIFLIEED
jgi:hypothetical protein